MDAVREAVSQDLTTKVNQIIEVITNIRHNNRSQ